MAQTATHYSPPSPVKTKVTTREGVVGAAGRGGVSKRLNMPMTFNSLPDVQLEQCGRTGLTAVTTLPPLYISEDTVRASIITSFATCPASAC